jgi:hypothetical protein
MGALALATITMATSGATREEPDWQPTLVPVASPAAAGSAQPQLTVSSRGVLLSWVERSGTRATLKFAERTSAGWSTPVAVASGDDWFVNWADVPSVRRLSNGTLAAHWLQKSGPGTYAYDVRLAYSTDDGRSWSPSFLPHHDATKTEHGFASLFEMPGAGLGLIWLDGRAMTPASGHDGHGGAGAMSVRFASFDTSWKQTADMPVDARVCECCPTTAVVTNDGIVAAFRNRTDDEVRDIYVARFEQGKWSEPRPVHDDGWRIPACPVNGPMLAARERNVAMAWFTVKEDQGQAYVAFSSDAGRTFAPPVRLDDVAALGRVDIDLLDDGSAVASWVEFADQRAQVRVRRVHSSGAKSVPTTIASIDGGRASGYPRLARYGEELVFAWTASREGVLQVQTAVASVPSGAAP